MGIRFDKDTRRATNGPLIFFSLLRDENFAQEINSAFYQNLSFYAYRMPGDSMMTFGSSEGYVEGLGTPGFVIGMFSPQLPLITIPYKGSKRVETKVSYYSQPQVSTPFESYSKEVEGIISDLKSGKGEKVVAARVEIREEQTELADKFFELNERFPNAFVFCFSTPATGCWIGASPELLLKSENGYLETMSLAGTRRAAGDDTAWDAKNLEEQRIVTDYISGILKNNGLNPQIKGQYTKSYGDIEHICNEIAAPLPSDYTIPGDLSSLDTNTPDNSYKSDLNQGLSFDLEKFLRELYPTPALCGSPKDFAMQEIAKYESFDRGCYGGFCGPFRGIMDFHFNVVLRCASVSALRLCIYVGGGITKDSVISSEWTETQLKLRQFLS